MKSFNKIFKGLKQQELLILVIFVIYSIIEFKTPKPLAELGVDIGRSIDTREAKSLEDLREAEKLRNEKIAALTGAQVEMDVGMAKAQGEFARKLRALEAVYEVKRENITESIY